MILFQIINKKLFIIYRHQIKIYASDQSSGIFLVVIYVLGDKKIVSLFLLVKNR